MFGFDLTELVGLIIAAIAAYYVVRMWHVGGTPAY